MKKSDCFEIGYISKTKGLDGQVTAVLDVDNPTDYANLDSTFLEIKGRLVPFLIEEINITSDKTYLYFEDINDIEEAKVLVGAKILLSLENLPDLEGEEFYYHEIVGYQVIDKQKGELGKVDNIYDSTSQVLIGLTFQNKEILVPLVDDIIEKVDKENQELHLDIPEGLIEVYLED